jgi:hypothetical protein
MEVTIRMLKLDWVSYQDVALYHFQRFLVLGGDEGGLDPSGFGL